MSIKASDVIDWTKRDYAFIPRGDGRRASLVAWGRAPRDGEVLALRNGDRASCYQVVGCSYSLSADADVFTLDLVFIPGSTIVRDT